MDFSWYLLPDQVSNCYLLFRSCSNVHLFRIVHEVCMDGTATKLSTAGMSCFKWDSTALPTFPLGKSSGVSMVFLVHIELISFLCNYHWVPNLVFHNCIVLSLFYVDFSYIFRNVCGRFHSGIKNVVSYIIWTNIQGQDWIIY